MEHLLFFSINCYFKNNDYYAVTVKITVLDHYNVTGTQKIVNIKVKVTTFLFFIFFYRSLIFIYLIKTFE